MGRIKGCLRNNWRALLALVVLTLVPAALEASGFGFRNDTPYPIYVQGATIVGKQIQRGPLLCIKPGCIAWDVNLMKGNRTITVYDAANRKLFQDVRIFSGDDQFFAVVPLPVQRGQPPRVNLIPEELKMAPAK
jgi:hypothetical protein